MDDVEIKIAGGSGKLNNFRSCGSLCFSLFYGLGFKTTSLVKNQADLYLHTSKIYKWDVCAPNAILNNLGGHLTMRNGKKINYASKGKSDESVDGIIASLYNYDYFFNMFKKE